MLARSASFGSCGKNILSTGILRWMGTRPFASPLPLSALGVILPLRKSVSPLLPQTIHELSDMASFSPRPRVLRSGFGWLLVLVLIAPWGARADDDPPASLSPEERAAIRKVIESQLAAFQRDDGKAAFSYAAPEIQSQFRTPENFMRMVRQGYRVLYRPLQIHFKSTLTDQGRIVQPILATAEDGRTVIALYLMKRQPGGKWRIGGVVLVPTDQKGA